MSQITIDIYLKQLLCTSKVTFNQQWDRNDWIIWCWSQGY